MGSTSSSNKCSTSEAARYYANSKKRRPSSVFYFVNNSQSFGRRPSRQTSRLTRFSTCSAKHQSRLYVIGGQGSDGVLESLDQGKRVWMEKIYPEFPSDAIWTDSVDNTIFVFHLETGVLQSFDTLGSCWKSLKRFPAFRHGMCLVKDNHKIYAIGGDDTTRCNRYSITEDSWELISNMICNRTYASATTLRGQIYCSGGLSGNEPRNGMEIYDPDCDLWQCTPPMSVSRHSHCLVTCAQCVWAVGGEGASGTIKDLERYDPLTACWTRLAPMPTKRSRLTSKTFGGLIYAIGGWDGKNLGVTEVFNPSYGNWVVSAPLSKARSYAGSCVIGDVDHEESDTESSDS